MGVIANTPRGLQIGVESNVPIHKKTLVNESTNYLRKKRYSENDEK